MLRFIKSFFGKGVEPKSTPAEAPYKVEAPEPLTLAPVLVEETKAAPTPVKCGCGRSSTGFCVGLHKLSQEEWDAHPDNVKAKAKTKPAAKKSVPAKKKPAAMKAPAKPKAAKKPKAK